MFQLISDNIVFGALRHIKHGRINLINYDKKKYTFGHENGSLNVNIKINSPGLMKNIIGIRMRELRACINLKLVVIEMMKVLYKILLIRRPKLFVNYLVVCNYLMKMIMRVDLLRLEM